MRFDYPDGVLPEERPIVEKFERDVLPFIERHGSQMGDDAVKGDLDAEEVIRRYKLFVEGMAHLRAQNLRIMIAALKRWEAKSRQ